MSQLFGESVGWDGDTQTVTVGDVENAPQNGGLYALGAVTPFAFGSFSYEYRVFDEKYWDTSINKITVLSAKMNDDGEYVLSLQFEGMVNNVGVSITPALGFRAVFYDAYGEPVGDATAKVSTTDGNHLTVGVAVIKAPKKAVSMGVDTNAVQKAI
jgi:hypothetical protein